MADRAPKPVTGAALRTAMARGHLSLLYQPKIFIDTGRLAGVEALSRWQDESGEWIDPASFIAIAESEGLIDSVTEWGLGRALEDWSGWRDRGLTTQLSFNVSALCLRNLHFPDFVERLCQTRNVPPAHLTVELTESASQEIISLTDTLTRFRIKGMSVALDDFGTGFSSLLQLRRLPFTELKIDRCFVQDIMVAEDSRMITKAIIDLAHAMGLSATAEGVESVDALIVLGALGCDQAQGNFVSLPIPAERVPTWIFNASPGKIRPSGR